MHDEEFSETIIKSNKVEAGNIPLLTKLFQLGIIDSMQVIDQKFWYKVFRRLKKCLVF